MKRFLSVIFASLVFSLAAIAGDGISAAQAKIKADQNKLLSDITYLATSCGGRATGTAGAADAGNYIYQRLRSFPGIEVMSQHFFTGGTTTARNIMAFLQGNRKAPCRKYILVLAHYDGLGTIDGRVFPGADSNASGVAALIALAEKFAIAKLASGRALSHSIIFVAVDGHHKNLLGSNKLFDYLQLGILTDPTSGNDINLADIDLVVNIDQVGSTMSPITKGNPNYLIALGSRTLPSSARNLLKSAGLELGLDYYGSPNFTEVFETLSDQRPFVKAGRPFLLFTSGITMQNNKVTDTPSSLSMEVLDKRIFFIYNFLDNYIRL